MYMVQYRRGESHKNTDALSRHPCNWNSNSPLCKQCGPLLEPTDESKKEIESKTGLGNELGIACVLEDELSGESKAKATVGRSLRPEAPIFVLRIKYEEIAEENEGREAGTISVETDQLTKRAHLSVPRYLREFCMSFLHGLLGPYLERV